MRALLLFLVLAAPAGEAERKVAVGSFDRVRIAGDYQVRVLTGRSPGAVLTGPAAALEQVDLQVNGSVLSLATRGPRVKDGAPVTVTLLTPAVVAASLVGAGSVTVDAMTGPRADLSVAGSGMITVEALTADQVAAASIGEGRLTLAGRSRALRLSTTGSGTVDAAGLVTDELVVRLNGTGETRAQARYQATIWSTGAGKVTVTGKPKCAVRAPAGSAVTCGAG